jgi:iron complex outermembrane receptor protein/vitamin B12 transporter
LRGKIVDQLGNRVPNARIVLVQDGHEVVQGKSDAEGLFELAVPSSGLYSPRVEATGFETQILPPVDLKSGKTEELTVSLRIGPLIQQVVVSATGTPMPIAQVGASISVIDSDQIKTLNKLDVLEYMRFIPGAQVMQTGQRGGATSLFIRGGESNFNKVLVDGIPVNYIGGDFDYAQLSNSGVGSVEVLRGSNSVLYGSDALSGVVNITSARGATAIPELIYSTDGGNFGTLNQTAALGGANHNFDYYSKFSRFDTRGDYPNDFFHNATVSANLGWNPAPTTGFRATVRHTTTDLGSPNAHDFYGISDLATQRNENTYAGFTAQQQTTNRWHSSAQFAFEQYTELFADPAPTGQIDANGDYLGNVVTIKGANGYSVTGQAILDYGIYSGVIYPASYPYYEARRSAYGETDYRFFGDWTGVAGFRYEHENGNDDGYVATRDNYSSFLEAHGSVAHRLFVTTGVGIEHNAVFGLAGTPRVSAAYYLRSPSASNFFGDTKLKFNFGKGIKEPSIAAQLGSLYYVLTPAQITQYDVSPTGPERSKTYDFGVEQRVWNGRALVGATFFYNDFYDIIAYLNAAALLSIGVPQGVINDLPGGAYGGAYVNADSTRSLGSELELKIDLGHGLMFQGEYTYLDAVVRKTFGSAVYNTAPGISFSNIPIGAYSPLQGARPFARAPHSGSFNLLYNRKKLSGALSGYLVSRCDDSTFLSDQNYETTMLLPNRNLAPAYQKFDLSAGYSLTPYAKLYASVENLFSQHYQETFGYPGMPFTVRGGLTFDLGGRRGWWKQ